jgi:RNA polymerase sigma-70 factor (ECF subfamily)
MIETLPDSTSLSKWSQEEEMALVQSARKNPAAFTPLYRHFVRPVYRYLYALAGNGEDADDLTAQVFLEALEGLGRYRSDRPFAAWLFTIARHRAMDHFRKRRLDVEYPETLADADPAADPQTATIRAEELRRLRVQVAGLPEEEREMLCLRYAAELSFSEIAATMNRTVGAVKMGFYRLLERMAKDWEEPHGE